ncbi:hypothetical protein [Antrihabitans spumae]
MRVLDPLRALLTLVVAYVAVSTLGFGIYLGVAAVMGQSPWDEVAVRDNIAYQRVAVILPILNLAVWTCAARWYFSGRRLRYPAWPLGLAWLIVALLLDYLAFVVPTHPLSLDHTSFYLEQGPWIYLTYLAVAVSAFLGRWWVTAGARHRVDAVPDQ